MKFNLITVSTRSTNILSTLRTKTGLTPNISARFAICMSLKDRSVPNPDEFNKGGSKLEPDVLFGKHEQIYLALMLNRLKADRLDPELYLNEMTRAHLNRGVIALGPRINDLSNFNKYLEQVKINSFEKDILKELNTKLKQNYLFLFSENNWFLIFDKNNLSIENIKLLEDFNTNSLENNNNNIYTIYSKDELIKEENIIKQSNYKKIFLVETDNLNFISNTLVNEADIDLISNEFFSLRGDSHAKYFLNKKLNLRNPYSIQTKTFSYLENINYFFKNIINLSIIEFKAIIKQSIPETAPFYYAETNLKIFND